jgi:hypothetical protein
MRPPLVVPFDEARQPGPEIPASHRDVKQSRVFVLQTTDEAFDHSNASVLAVLVHRVLRHIPISLTRCSDCC